MGRMKARMGPVSGDENPLSSAQLEFRWPVLGRRNFPGMNE